MGGITFPEILAEFGYIFESVSCKATVASAFSELRLHASLNDVQNAAEFVVNILNKVLENPFDKKFWRVKEMSDTFHTKLGRFAGGSTLLQAVGFKRERDPGSAEFYYYLKWPKGKSPNEKMIAAMDSTNNTVSPALDNALKTLRGFRTEVETEIKHLNGGMATVSEAISALHTKTADWEQTSDALKLALQYIGNILKNPDDARCWRIRSVNPIFQRRIGRFGHEVSSMIMSSIGFLTSALDKNIYVLKNTEEEMGSSSKFRFPTLEKSIAALLWRRKAEIEMALKSIKEGRGHLFVSVKSKLSTVVPTKQET